MKGFPLIVLFSILYACNSASSQQTDDLKREEEFVNAMKNAEATKEESHVLQKEADEKTSSTIERAANTIVSLKQEVQDLKQELNEVNKKFDSIDTDPGVRFIIRPISDTEEDRQ